MASLRPSWINVGDIGYVWRSQIRQFIMNPHSVLTKIKPHEPQNIITRSAMDY